MNVQTQTPESTATINPGERGFADRETFRVFSRGALGEMHVLAHHLTDEGRYRLGHDVLGAWLEGHDGAGSDWIHLQWHMAVFELAVGKWGTAFERFCAHILPAAVTTETALTDAPAMLWRLRLESRHPVALPWEPVRRTALRAIGRTGDRYVELHSLLALAGAGDLESLDRWLRSHALHERVEDAVLRNLAVGLRAFASEDYETASLFLDRAVPRVSLLGGSRAQNALFERIGDLSRHRKPVRSSREMDLAA